MTTEDRRDAAAYEVVRVPVIPLKPILVVILSASVLIGGWYATNFIIAWIGAVESRFVEKKISGGLSGTSFMTKPGGNAKDFESMSREDLAGALYMTFSRYNSCVESKAQAAAILSDQ